MFKILTAVWAAVSHFLWPPDERWCACFSVEQNCWVAEKVEFRNGQVIHPRPGVWWCVIDAPKDGLTEAEVRHAVDRMNTEQPFVMTEEEIVNYSYPPG